MDLALNHLRSQGAKVCTDGLSFEVCKVPCKPSCFPVIIAREVDVLPAEWRQMR
jgi:hypothetical protein